MQRQLTRAAPVVRLVGSVSLLIAIIACGPLPDAPQNEQGSQAEPAIAPTQPAPAGDQAEAPSVDTQEAARPACARLGGVDGERLRREDLGERWPLTVEEGCLYCDRVAVIFTANGRTYGVNGPGLTRFGPIDEIWAPSSDPDQVAMHELCLQGAREEGYPESDCVLIRKDIGPLIERGLARCRH